MINILKNFFKKQKPKPFRLTPSAAWLLYCANNPSAPECLIYDV